MTDKDSFLVAVDFQMVQLGWHFKRNPAMKLKVSGTPVFPPFNSKISDNWQRIR